MDRSHHVVEGLLGATGDLRRAAVEGRLPGSAPAASTAGTAGGSTVGWALPNSTMDERIKQRVSIGDAAAASAAE